MTKVLAFYLPQFHPTAENDAWWGPGFSEWTNVAKARPRFFGHYQPHIPADLGFYDLRLDETREAQADLARSYGIDGFCYYHYWFGGKRLLHRPIDAVLSTQQPDFPFCFCWANENWTKNWSGENRLVLMPQTHSREDDLEHIQWLLKAFKDPRYISVGGRPLMLIYRSDLLPETTETLKLWRSEAKKHGFADLYLVGVLNNFSKVDERMMLGEYGFDAVVEFQPHVRYLSKFSIARRVRNRAARAANAIAAWIRKDPSHPLFKITDQHSYVDLVRQSVEGLLARRDSPDRVLPCVIPSWDNSPRRADGARVVQNLDPEPYKYWLTSALASAAKFGDEGLVFVNAWNEWAEGCHLEPDLRVGHGFLKATKEALLAQANVEERCHAAGSPPSKAAIVDQMLPALSDPK